MGEAGLEASVGFPKGMVGACPQVGLVGRTMARDLSRGGYRLRNSSGSLSADGWGCVLTQLVVWPEASQQWTYRLLGGARSLC